MNDEQLRDSRTNELGIYTQGFERIRVPIDANLKTAIKIKVIKDKEGMWRSGHDVYGPGFLSNRPICWKSKYYIIKTYKTRKEAIVEETRGVISLLKSKYSLREEHEIIGALRRFVISQEQMELKFFNEEDKSEQNNQCEKK